MTGIKYGVARGAPARYTTLEPEEVREMPKTGDLAPDFTASDHLGNEISLAKLRGKTVVLWFFPKADTPG